MTKEYEKPTETFRPTNKRNAEETTRDRKSTRLELQSR